MTEVTAADPQSDRYGRSRTPQRRLSRRATIIAAAVIAVAVVVIGVINFQPSQEPTDPRTLNYEIVDSATTQVSVAIYPDETRSVHCIVQATNDREAIVGFTEVSLEADPQADPTSPKQIDVTLATTQLAASGHADACWFE
ncbi:DUF4307 domain-containing protein [Brevibacterium sp. 2SA]|uniref:DUF4307 domain-containing protein n=1 Tax=Brevibacterium sp. 2SA TaxID=2502198 RepID=UPI0010FA5E91|nr:DUF4307 domain-containing protein [Brevibacterium sp. 2SA]